MTRRKYMSADAAAAWLGWVGSHRGERLVRIMLGKEQLYGRQIMARAGGPKKTCYLLTRPMLERYCSELFLKTPDELVNRLRPALERLEGRVEAIVDERLAPQLEELRVADDLQAQAIENVERRVARLEGRRRG